MPEDQWIVVPNWDTFQHYKDRDITWIKLYLELRSKDEWRQLTLAARGLLVSIWCEYAASNGVIRHQDVTARVAQKVRRSTLDSLVAAGFIELSASKPLALRYQRASARALAREVLRTSKSPLAPATQNGRASGKEKIPQPPCPDCGIGSGLHTADCPAITHSEEPTP